MENSDLQKISADLQNAFLQLSTKNDIFSFLRDLLTEDEIIEFSLRYTIAQRLYHGQQYKTIEQET